MSAGLDMSLDEIIAKKRPSRGARTGGPTRTGGIAKRSGGPVRNPRSSQVRPRPYSNTAATASSNLNASPEGKILVSNLAYKVTEADLWELFSTMIGPVRQVNLNFDQSGRSKGTASVVFARKNDAVRSVEKLRNITLDGREMKIEIVVAPNVGPITQRIGGINESRPSTRGTGGSRGTPTRGGRGGRGGRRSDNRPKKTQEELDAEMSEYMQIDEDSNQAGDSSTAQLTQA
ncbi:RNA-binding domain-containing protein [Rhizophagus irregularis]|uniref:RNA-binding domain-containing protein n=4 Tax=Rhizophagus irregularis TaxID=588596 RepID=A0A2I1H8J6_9GLOM|nr:Yra1p [Rhizophagus irregularis DAOM 197198w]PKC00734.1 RNA-binding domain-containing protein [Rhizophagus irregularis]GBC31644.1 THO complex subunit 4A-like [Rhizophagus irregularis DAOM 181602=DAOM 197198]PKC58201.1 RNA-binding domain-containing protein [Rhizophagus irregularis]PKK62314.1 RNA-binding domain-containing protein [Rhizophagus irregularis]